MEKHLFNTTTNDHITKRRNPYKPLFFYFLTCLIIGFIFAEIMGAALVAKSNKSLLAEQEWLEKNGYIAVPGTTLSSEILSWKTYFAGGLFFSLSLGLCYAFIWGLLIWVLKAWKKICILTTLLVSSLILYLYLSQPGWPKLWMFGVFLLGLPVLFLFLNYQASPILRMRAGSRNGIFYFAGIGIILLGYGLYLGLGHPLNSTDFISIRDRLFGRNAIGRKINHFYYHYTLYPARAIKSFDQRLQKVFTVDPNNFTEMELSHIKSRFVWRDVFIGSESPSNTIIKKAPGSDKISIICRSPSFTIETDFTEINEQLDKIIKEYNKKSDPALFLRRTISISLFHIWPVMGILFLYTLFLFLSPLFFKVYSPIRDPLIASVIILIILWGGYYLFRLQREPSGINGLIAALEDESPNDKLSALIFLNQMIKREGYNVDLKRSTGILLNMLEDPDPIIKKWVIVSLGDLNEKGALKRLSELLDDPDLFIAYHAARSLGKLRAYEAKDPLLKIVRGRHEWYLKSTAYLSLRELGWRQ